MQLFCDHCDRHVSGIRKSLTREVSIRGEQVTVNYTGYVCPYCCEELYDEEVESEVMALAKAQYKKQMHLLSEATFTKYMQRNQMNNEEMAQLLNCTVQELIAVRIGGIQSKDLDKKMRNVMKRTA